jgi:ABC-2 type transport system permease protein
MSTVRAYASIFSIRFQALLQYRAVAFAGLVTQFFWGLMLVMIYQAFYRSSTRTQPIDCAEVITYVWLGQAFLVMLPWNADPELAALMRNGNIAYELLRPLDLYTFWYVRCAALRTAPMLLRAAPMFIITGLFFHLSAPASLASAFAWGAAMLGALLLGCAITMLTSISLLWTVAGDGFSLLTWSGVSLLSGMIIPLPLFPAWAQTPLRALPFSGLLDMPFRLYLGHLPPSALGGVLAHQLIWTIILIAGGRFLLARGMRRLVVQGG